MKQRFTYLDLQVVQNEFQSLVGYRLQNIYDLVSSSRHLMLKFAKPDSRKVVVVDPGFKIYPTDYARSTPQTPSGFVAKLRKHLKTRRLVNVVVTPPDNRVLVFSFSEAYLYHLVFEFFAGGNVILLDKECKILAVQRVVSATQTHSRCAVGERYPLEDYLEVDVEDYFYLLTKDAVASWLRDADDSANSEGKGSHDGSKQNPLSSVGSVKPAKKDRMTLARLIYSKVPGTSVSIIEAHLRKNGVDPKLTSAEFSQLVNNESQIDSVLTAVKEAGFQCEHLSLWPGIPGFILAKRNPKFSRSGDGKTLEEAPVVVQPDLSLDPTNLEYLYEEFEPFKMDLPEKDSEEYQIIELPTFGKAVDVYFSTLEATKASLRLLTQESLAEKKLNAAKREKETRISGLVRVQEKSEMVGAALQNYSERAEEAMEAVKGLLNQGMDWVDIERLIEAEQTRGNPVAQTISLPLNLAKNRITLKLPESFDTEQSDSDLEDLDSEGECDNSSDDGNTQRAVNIVEAEVDLNLSVWANARKYFDIRKTAIVKQTKTAEHADQAYKSAEKKIKRDLEKSLKKEANNQGSIHAMRQPYWFEKFYWFLTSDGYLCLGGRDSFQNELLLQRYFKENDLYVHSDFGGASVVIIKNHTQEPSIPPSSITQAATFCVATSKAWDSKANGCGWYATRDQIPKFTKEGDVVTSENIVVLGQGKQFLPTSQLDMGIAFLWLVPENLGRKYIRPGMEEASYTRGQPQKAHNISDSEGEVSEEDEKKNDDEGEGEKKVGEKKAGQEEEEEEEEEEAGDEENENGDSEGSEGTGVEGANTVTDASSNETSKIQNIAQGIEEELASLKVGSNKEKSEQQKPYVRGKKGKMKKIATKYQDQDEEERKLRMEILGTVRGLEEKKAKQEEARQKKLAQEKLRKERQKRAKEAEIKRLLDDSDDHNNEDLVYPFAYLVPRLQSGDKPLHAVPLFGPWSALQRFKFKIKIQRGSVKKGKAVKDILYALSTARTDPKEQDTDLPWQSELNCIKAIKEPEIVLCVPVSKLKPTIPGSSSNRSRG